MIKVTKKGKKIPVEIYKVTCKKCQTEFEFIESQLYNDVNYTSILCPNRTCSTVIIHKLKKY